MSNEIELLKCKINENIQTIEYLKLINDRTNKNDVKTLIYLEDENVKLNDLLKNLKKNEKKGKKKLTLRDIMIKLDFFNKRGIINALSIQDGGINACIEYTYVSFKIPKNTEMI